MLPVVPGHGAVGGFGLDRLAVRGHQHRGHQAQRTVALGDDVGLDVAVVVLARPHVAAFPLQAGGHHVVDEAVFVGQTAGVELRLVLLVEDALELVFEHAVVGLEDGVLGRQVHRVVLLQRIGERRTGEVLDRLLEVVHPHDDAAVLGDVHHLVHDRLAAVVGGERQHHGAGAVDLEVGGAVLVAESVPADDDRLGPAGHQTGDVGDDDRRAEDGAAQDIPDGAVRREPHLLEVELLDAGLVGSDGRALDADMVLEDGVRGVDGDLVVGGIAMLDTEVVVLQVHVEVRQDQSVFDELPDDPCHLVAVKLDDGALDLDLASTRHVSRPSSSAPRAGARRANITRAGGRVAGCGQCFLSLSSARRPAGQAARVCVTLRGGSECQRLSPGLLAGNPPTAVGCPG